mgnify:CR=1 FL=1
MKFEGAVGLLQLVLSAPTRGPWIEMAAALIAADDVVVGPHTGAVD